MNIFLSTSFSHKVDEQGRVLPNFRAKVEALLSELRTAGHTVYAAVEWDKWAISAHSPEYVAEVIIRELDKAGCVVALVGTNASAGVQWEIGYANARAKRVIVLPESEGVELGYWNKALVEQGRIECVANTQQLVLLLATRKKLEQPPVYLTNHD